MAHSESKTTLQFCRYSSSRELAQEEKNRSADNSKYKSHTATHRTTWCKLCCKHAAIFPTSITFSPLYFSLSSKIYQKSPCQYPKINSDTSIAKYHRLCMCLVLHHRKLRFKDYNHKQYFMKQAIKLFVSTLRNNQNTVQGNRVPESTHTTLGRQQLRFSDNG